MNKNNNAKGLVDHLEQEISWIDALNTLLSEEKLVLATRQFDKLEDLAEKKQKLTNELEKSAKLRAELISDSSSNQDPKTALNEFLKNTSAEEARQINLLNTKLAEKLTYCRELNTVNGQVIASNIYTRQEIVNALSGNKTEAASVYTANGDITSSSNTKHHEEA